VGGSHNIEVALCTDPWRYRLENADDGYYDRGELPPIRFD